MLTVSRAHLPHDAYSLWDSLINARRNARVVTVNSATPPQLGGQVFVDETKSGDYLLVAVPVLPGQLALFRKTIRGLVLPGQRRIHMHKESPARKREILGAITAVVPEVRIYRANRNYSGEIIRRRACLTALVRDAVSDERTELILDEDPTMHQRDDGWIIDALRETKTRHPLAHRHAHAATEPLLVLPDVIGWAWARKGEWRNRLSGVAITLSEA